ncbi:MAG: threonine--tRNA ligase [Nitrospirae bacterium]|nr:threonine--tRNA ligase [Nitrospirota bacterium]
MTPQKSVKETAASLQEVTVRFPDGTELRFAKGALLSELLTRANPRWAEPTVALKVNGTVMGLGQRLLEAPGGTDPVLIEPIFFSSPEGQEVYRHSSAHIMAQAVKELYPNAKLAIGPPIEDGFYYDFDLGRPFTPEDLEKIERKMKEIIASRYPFERKALSKKDAIRFFEEKDERYKVELIRELPEDEIVTVYEQGPFTDLCRGPHVVSTQQIAAFKLLTAAGAYWRGDERNPMLQRIYGTSFPTQEALEAHLKRLEEIKRRDHRRLGKDLDLYNMIDEIGPGLVIWHPKGALIRKLIEDFWREQHLRHGYDFVYSPHIARLDLWKQSGHLDFYRENMYAPISIEGIEYELKPMNCPFHIMIYKSHLRSYRDLPLRFAELGTVYRYERSGVLHGLMRVRGFTQDDAHLFCRPDQIEQEILKVLDLTVFTLKTFGFDEYEIYVSTRPEKAVGSAENWERATAALEAALRTKNMAYRIDPGEGVFYGPKIDLKIKDVLGRSWQCTTVQVDFNLPERFHLSYIGEDGKEHQPIMIHRALMGSIERFFGVLIEHYAGAFPLWLAPVQMKVMPITDRQHAYAHDVAEALTAAGFRVETDARNEKIGLKIREAEMAKTPYMVILGAREVQGRKLSVRKRSGENVGELEIPSFIERLNNEVSNKSV